MFYFIIILFISGYVAIALEHRISVDKTAIALVTGALIWVCIAFGSDTICFALPSFHKYLQIHPGASVMEFVTRHELARHIGRISEVLFFLLGSMTIVKIIENHGGFILLSKLIKTTNKVSLLWIFSFLTFFMSAVFDNLTTTILMINLMWRIVGAKKLRLQFASMIVIAANTGGACSPIGDISTIMLWIGGNMSALNIILQLFVPCLICMLVPLVVLSLNIKGKTVLLSRTDSVQSLIPTTDRERWLILLSGIGGLMLVPVFRSVTKLPPYIGVLLVSGIIWIMTEMIYRNKQKDFQVRMILGGIFKEIDMSTIFFSLGILLAVAGLQSAGHLHLAGVFLNEKIHSIYIINLIVGALSSVVDNITLIAGSMNMYDLVSQDALSMISDPAKAAYMRHFVSNGSFWELLAYSVGTGGNILIAGSLSGIAAMGLAKIDFMWYIRKMSLLALAGFLSGFAAYYLIVR